MRLRAPAAPARRLAAHADGRRPRPARVGGRGRAAHRRAAGARDGRDVRGPAGRRGLVGAAVCALAAEGAAGRRAPPRRSGAAAAAAPSWPTACAATPRTASWCCATRTPPSTRRSGPRGRPSCSPRARRSCSSGRAGLLGEGWDCPPVNVLVDMTAVAADVSVRQMRGRSLRLDPADPAKIANNWDVVCVAPVAWTRARGLRALRAPPRPPARAVRGRDDRDRAVARAPRALAVRAAGRRPLRRDQHRAAGARRRSRRRAGALERRRALPRRRPRRARRPQSPTGRGGDGRSRRRPSPACGPPRWRWLHPRRAYPPQLPLEWAAGAVCDAYVALGELPAEVARSMQFSARPEGWVRVSLPTRRSR